MRFCLAIALVATMLTFLGACVMLIIIVEVVINLTPRQFDAYFWATLMEKRAGKYMILQIKNSLFLEMYTFMKKYFL